MKRLTKELKRSRGVGIRTQPLGTFANGAKLNSDLKITRIQAFQVDLPLHEGSYKWANGKSVDSFDSTVIKVDTNAGVVGFGESCPLGPNYLPAFADGLRAGLRVLAPALLGRNPVRLTEINAVMDMALKGHPYVKSGLDMACWDILGKVAGLPVCDLLGGRFGESFQLYRAISQEPASEMRRKVEMYLKQGYRKFQLKVGGSVREDIDRIFAVREMLDYELPLLRASGEQNLQSIPLMCDANTGWLRHEAMQVVQAVSGLRDVYIEQPCLSYEECLSVRHHCALPMILDECVDDIGVLVRIVNDKACDLVNLKISKLGGITKMRTVRDLAVQSGIAMNIEDTWGGDIVTAAIAHVAHSTPPDNLFCSTDFNSYGPKVIALTSAQRRNGTMAAPTEPGLGVEPLLEQLGCPVLDIRL